MAIKDILVYVDTQPGAQARIAFAAGLAKKNNAHLTGLHVKAEVIIPVTENDVVLPESVIEDQERAIDEQAVKAKQLFEAGVAGGVDAEWLVGRGFAAEVARHHARASDLVVVSQQAPDSPDSGDVPEGLMQDTGRPTLILPYTGTGATFAETIMIAWDDSVPATRAVHDALALLTSAKKVQVVAVQTDKDAPPGDNPCKEICAHLVRHGIKAEAVTLQKGSTKISELLLAHASAINCDLLVMGSYNHSRWREFIFGGVTEEILEKMTIPVFTSH